MTKMLFIAFEIKMNISKFHDQDIIQINQDTFITFFIQYDRIKDNTMYLLENPNKGIEFSSHLLRLNSLFYSLQFMIFTSKIV